MIEDGGRERRKRGTGREKANIVGKGNFNEGLGGVDGARGRMLGDQSEMSLGDPCLGLRKRANLCPF